ncbi:hypothetical protein [Mycobacteroides immunogenum]|nr:hypothetical protein [Mycobacteroides immunogenum]MCV7306599.1 hypothetical protein [Mycobacteroides immunogenum]
MGLRDDVLRLIGDEPPITGLLAENITQILAAGDAAAGTYDVDKVLTAFVFAFRELEESIIQDRQRQELWGKLHE